MNLAEYFALHRPAPKYQIGDRIEGTYKGIPWVGTAYTDNLRNYDEGAMVNVHLDLPMKVGTEWLNYIRVTYKEIKGLRK
jgi:hypothetical protein